jgi:hypothetical protein
MVASHWTTVVTHPDELGWLREALQLRAAGDGGANWNWGCG